MPRNSRIQMGGTFFSCVQKRGGGRTTLLANRCPFAHANFLPSYFGGRRGLYDNCPLPLNFVQKTRLLRKIQVVPVRTVQYVTFYFPQSLQLQQLLCRQSGPSERSWNREKVKGRSGRGAREEAFEK